MSRRPTDQTDQTVSSGKMLQASAEDFSFTFQAPSQTSSLTEPEFVNTAGSQTSATSPPSEYSKSLSESVQNFPVEFGRTYHAYRAGSYAFPNDLPEQERLDLQAHALLKLFDGRLFFSPLRTSNPPRHVLDIATGLGDWAIQMGDMFPSAEIIATDLSPIQPDAVPPNVSFYVEDSSVSPTIHFHVLPLLKRTASSLLRSDSWDYPHKFDYIHTRVTGGCWSSFEEQVVQQAFEALEPGGYLESQEIDSSLGCDDGTLDQNGALMRWASDITTAGERCDRSTLVGQTLKEAYERVGFVDVQEIVFRIPVNGWPRDRHLREIGAMWEANLVSGLSGLSLSLFHRAFDRSPAETEVFLVDVRREVSNPNVHAWMPCYVVWGRKPLTGETDG